MKATCPIRTGVILAAGAGSRMGSLGSRYPKPLLPICNEPLIRRHMELLRDCGIERVHVVIGHRGHQIVRHLSERPVGGIAVHYVEQESRLGIAHAVGRLEPHLDEPFVLLLGDIAFDAPGLSAGLLHLPHGVGALLAVKEEPDLVAIRKNFSVELGADGAVCRVEEKPHDPPNQLKGCGLYAFDRSIFAAIRRTPRSAFRDEYEITHSIQILIETGVRVEARAVVTWDINLTTPADLLACNLYYKARTGLDVLLGRGLQLAPGTVLRDSVVGDGVRVEHPIEITGSLLMPGAVIQSQQALRGVVVDGREVMPGGG